MILRYPPRRRSPSPVLAGILTVFALAACSRSLGESRPDALDRIYASDAAFTAVFPPAEADGEPVVCEGLKSGSAFALTVVSPARSAGITASFSADGTCVLSVPGSEETIPADPRAARALTVPFSLLCGAEEIESDGTPVIALPAIRRSADGGETEIRYPSGTLVLSAEGIPLRIRASDLAGGEREILFGAYEPAP